MTAYLSSYPSLLPVAAVPVRAALLSAAGRVSQTAWYDGDYIRVFVYSPSGTCVYESRFFRVYSEVPDMLTIKLRFEGKGYRVLVHVYHFPRHNPQYTRRSIYRWPHQWKRRRGSSRSSQDILLVPLGISIDDLRRTVNHFRARTPKTPKESRRRRERNSHPRTLRPNPVTVTKFVPSWNYNNGTGTSSSQSYLSYSRSFSSVTTPGFVKKRKTGKLPINDYSVTIQETYDGGYILDDWYSDGLGTFSTKGGSYVSQFGNPIFGGSPVVLTNSNVEFRAIRKLIDQVGDRGNVAQDLAQIGQTTRMISDAAKRIASSVTAVRHGNIAKAVSDLWGSNEPRFNPKRPPRRGDSAANNWLALQYGWKPLLDDIHGAMDAAARANVASVMTHTARSSARWEGKSQTDLKWNIAGFPRTGSQFSVTEIQVKYGMRYQIDNHLQTFLSQTGFTNPINLAWEILPYSFVIDWFLPIGPYLESLSAWDGLVFLDGYKTKIVRTTTYWDVGATTVIDKPSPIQDRLQTVAGSCFRKDISYVRNRLSAFPSQILPSFKNPLSGEHALNALALMRTAFR